MDDTACPVCDDGRLLRPGVNCRKCVRVGSAMNPQSACALLHELGQANLIIGSVTEVQLNWYRIEKAADTEQRIIVELLTHLLGRPPTDSEIQAATAH